MIDILLALPSTIRATIFNPNPTAHDLLLLISFIAIFWHAIFQLLHRILHPIALRQQWLRDAFAREYDRVGLSMCKALNVRWTKERYIQIFTNDWPKMQGIYLQHFVGGALALPAVCGWIDAPTASSLACLGVLSEMGWELSDMVDIFITRTSMPDGKERMPDTMVLIFAIHHSMTLSLGLPMVLKYRELRELHLLVFNLQWAAAIAIGVSEFTKCLDTSVKRQLWAFRVMNGGCFFIMAWMRGVQWVQLSWRMLNIWYDDEEWTCFGVGIVVCTLLTGFNFALCIYPFYKKMVKFSILNTAGVGMRKREDSHETLATEASSVEGDEDEFEEETDEIAVSKVTVVER